MYYISQHGYEEGIKKAEQYIKIMNLLAASSEEYDPVSFKGVLCTPEELEEVGCMYKFGNILCFLPQDLKTRKEKIRLTLNFPSDTIANRIHFIGEKPFYGTQTGLLLLLSNIIPYPLTMDNSLTAHYKSYRGISGLHNHDDFHNNEREYTMNVLDNLNFKDTYLNFFKSAYITALKEDDIKIRAKIFDYLFLVFHEFDPICENPNFGNSTQKFKDLVKDFNNGKNINELLLNHFESYESNRKFDSFHEANFDTIKKHGDRYDHELEENAMGHFFTDVSRILKDKMCPKN